MPLSNNLAPMCLLCHIYAIVYMYVYALYIACKCVLYAVCLYMRIYKPLCMSLNNYCATLYIKHPLYIAL